MSDQEVLVESIDPSDGERKFRQYAVHVFPVKNLDNSPTEPRFRQKFVLAPTDNTCQEYRPAQVMEDQLPNSTSEQPQIHVQFHREK